MEIFLKCFLFISEWAFLALFLPFFSLLLSFFFCGRDIFIRRKSIYLLRLLYFWAWLVFFPSVDAVICSLLCSFVRWLLLVDTISILMMSPLLSCFHLASFLLQISSCGKCVRMFVCLRAFVRESMHVGINIPHTLHHIYYYSLFSYQSPPLSTRAPYPAPCLSNFPFSQPRRKNFRLFVMREFKKVPSGWYVY